MDLTSMSKENTRLILAMQCDLGGQPREWLLDLNFHVQMHIAFFISKCYYQDAWWVSAASNVVQEGLANRGVHKKKELRFMEQYILELLHCFEEAIQAGAFTKIVYPTISDGILESYKIYEKSGDAWIGKKFVKIPQ